jgi:hypothetical protein
MRREGQGENILRWGLSHVMRCMASNNSGFGLRPRHSFCKQRPDESPLTETWLTPRGHGEFRRDES